jgi:hypothetical protein
MSSRSSFKNRSRSSFKNSTRSASSNSRVLELVTEGDVKDAIFLYEGQETLKICEAYAKGKVGCLDGSKCLDDHIRWDKKDNENKQQQKQDKKQ